MKTIPVVSCTDCKSLYDLTKNNTSPKCEEMRTALENMIIRERLKEGTIMRWIDTKAMLADSLTKSMDSTLLREILRIGSYKLIDEHFVLAYKAQKRENADKRAWFEK